MEAMPRHNYKEIFTSGIIKDNPIFVMLLALCPALGVTSTIVNSFGMGVIVLVILVITNGLISLIGSIIPDEIRTPVFITIIAAAVTILEMLVQAFLPVLFSALGIFLALAVVNCVIFGRAESFASKKPFLPSVLDAFGYGLGSLWALVAIGVFRELLGTGSMNFGFFTLTLFPAQLALPIFIQPTGAFIVLAMLIGVFFVIKIAKDEERAAALKSQKAAQKTTGKGDN